jgi:hypothetical protein
VLRTLSHKTHTSKPRAIYPEQEEGPSETSTNVHWSPPIWSGAGWSGVLPKPEGRKGVLEAWLRHLHALTSP